MTRNLRFAVLLLGLGGCNWYYNDLASPDDIMHRIPWFDHMIVSRAVHPYQFSNIPRRTPAGAVPVGGGERDFRTGVAGEMGSSFDVEVANKLTHPVTSPGPGARTGEAVFNIYCSVCHGYQGAGDGTVAAFGLMAPSLLTQQARNYKDGYIYGMLRYGRGLMPQYGDKIVRADERWAVVSYVRSLQAKAPVPAVTK